MQINNIKWMDIWGLKNNNDVVRYKIGIIINKMKKK